VTRRSRAAPEHPPDAEPVHPARSVGATRAGTWRLRYLSAPLPPRAASRAPRAAERTRSWSRPAPFVWSPIAAAAAMVRWSRAPASSPGAAITSASTVEPERWSTRYPASLPSTRWRNTPAAADGVSGGRTSRSRTATSLSLRPAGLADGLALKAQRYSQMSPRDSPQHLGSPGPSLPARDSACARQTSSPVAEAAGIHKQRPQIAAFRDDRFSWARSTEAIVSRLPRGLLRRRPTAGTSRAVACGPGSWQQQAVAPSGRADRRRQGLPRQPGGRSGAQQTRTGNAPERGPAPSHGQPPRKPEYVPPAPSREPR
jgi:hypothetical protein